MAISMTGDRSSRSRQGSASFLKKRSKKLSEIGSRAVSPAQTQITKVFFASFLFTKKKILPPA